MERFLRWRKIDRQIKESKLSASIVSLFDVRKICWMLDGRKKSSQTFLLSLFFCRNSVEKHYFIYTFWHYQSDLIRRASLRVVWIRNLSRYYFQDNIIELTSQGERDIIKFQLQTDCVNCTRAPWFCVF